MILEINFFFYFTENCSRRVRKSTNKKILALSAEKSVIVIVPFRFGPVNRIMNVTSQFVLSVPCLSLLIKIFQCSPQAPAAGDFTCYFELRSRLL